jgi:hypothetical protein
MYDVPRLHSCAPTSIFLKEEELNSLKKENRRLRKSLSVYELLLKLPANVHDAGPGSLGMMGSASMGSNFHVSTNFDLEFENTD